MRVLRNTGSTARSSRCRSSRCRSSRMGTHHTHTNASLLARLPRHQAWPYERVVAKHVRSRERRAPRKFIGCEGCTSDSAALAKILAWLCLGLVMWMEINCGAACGLVR